jgi:(p)ppGpp synthase/HD superfamily hydrolase
MFDPERYVAALRFAAERHHAQRVPDSDLPYLVHVVSVAAETIAALAPGSDADLAVSCALLHDTIEDTGTTHAELADRFGPAVADGVLALSKDSTLPKPDQMADSLRRIQAQPHAVWMVKLADRITNLAPPPRSWTTDKRRRYRDEAIRIADALGPASSVLDAHIRARLATYAGYLGEPGGGRV